MKLFFRIPNLILTQPKGCWAKNTYLKHPFEARNLRGQGHDLPIPNRDNASWFSWRVEQRIPNPEPAMKFRKL